MSACWPEPNQRYRPVAVAWEVRFVVAQSGAIVPSGSDVSLVLVKVMQFKVLVSSGCVAITLITASGGPARAGTTWPPATVPAQINVTTDSSSGWLPSQQQITEVQKIAEAFVTARNSGNSENAYALLADFNRENQPFRSFADGISNFNSKAGSAIELRFVKTTWTKNPAQAPVAGVYAALDFVGRYTNIDRYCGYLVLYQAPSGDSFRVMREEYVFLDNATAISMARQSSPATVEDVWAKASANCPGYHGSKVAAQSLEPLPEANGSFEYPTVEAALAALHAKSGVVFSTFRGWTIANDEAAQAIWSFPPPVHPAYPSAVKRQVKGRAGGGSEIDMKVLCAASKSVCDDLVRSFEQLNSSMNSGLPSHK